MDYSNSLINPDLLIRLWHYKGRPGGFIRVSGPYGVNYTLHDTPFGVLFIYDLSTLMKEPKNEQIIA